MSTYALLGATGQVGQAILTILLQDPSRKVNTFVRSRTKLETLSPEACRATDRVQIFEGDIKKIDVLAECIAGTRAVFMAIAAVSNEPNCRIAQDSAEAVVQALTYLKEQGRPLPPQLVVLSSAETEAKFSAGIPWPMRDILFASSPNIYHDLMKAETYLRGHADLASSTFVKPGGLSHDRQVGHKLSTEAQQTFISYLDMAAGMVEVAEDTDGAWDMVSVSVLSKEKAGVEWASIPLLFKGLLVHLFPGLYGWLF